MRQVPQAPTDTRHGRRTNITYRLREIHQTFDLESLKDTLCTYFSIEQDEVILYSLAYDAPYGRSSRQKVATVAFKTKPEILEVGNHWSIDLPLPGKPKELHNVSFDTTFDGFTPLTSAESEANTHTDCILIHGWAGHSIASFSSPDGNWFWPRDGLCHDLPAFRVWLYGYSSDLRDRGPITDVYEYADTFRRTLIDARKSSDPKIASRPLIYIVHSLGGYILQDTIKKMAGSDHVDDKITLSMTKGALLFGVPNQGMENQQLMSLLQKDDLPAVYTANLLDERYGFRLRMEQAHNFYNACSRNNAVVYAFYETEKTPTLCRDAETPCWIRNGPAALLVSQGSATYACPDQRNIIAWKSGHHDMLKLRRDDVQYETLLSRLREIIQKIERAQAGQDKPSPALDVQLQRTKSQVKEDNDCLKKLMVTDPRIDKKRIEATKGGLLTDSYRWILENKQFQTWRGASDNNLLWIRGDSGRGKTMLLCGVINELGQDPSLAYFFCQATDDRLNTAASVLRGLIYMLADTNPSIISHIRRRFDRGNVLEGINTWWILLDMLEDILRELTNICLVVDALDECEAEREGLIDLIVRTTSSTEYTVKWLVSSRNRASARNPLCEASILSLELNAESVSNAVDCYIHHKVSNLATKISYEEKTRAFVLDYLLKKANGTFLWVALVCARLEKVTSWNAEKAVLQFPPDLNTVYERMMEHVNQSEDADSHQHVLEVMATVYRPISLAELRILADLPEGISEAAIVEFIADCGSFLTVQERHIQFVHQTAKDYVDKYLANQKSANSQLLHRKIFDKSVHEMSRVLKKDIYCLKDPAVDISGIKVPDKDPLLSLRYSCLYWSQHLILSKLDHTEVLQNGIVYSFMKNKFLYWLEAMSLFKSVPQALILLYKLERYLESNYPCGVLSDLVHDAYRFAGYFSSIIISNPLQIYVSGFLFSPKQSGYNTPLMDEKPTWLELKVQQIDDWPVLIMQTSDWRSMPQYVAYSSDSKYIAMSHSHGGKTVWDAMSASLIGHLNNSLEGNPDMFASSGRSAKHTRSDVRLTSEQGNTLVNEELSESQAVSNKNGPCSYKFDVAFAPKSNEVYYYISNPYRIMSWSLQTDEVRLMACLDPSTTMCVLSLDGKHTAYIYEGNVALYKIDSSTHLDLIKENSSSFKFLAFSSNGNGLCACTCEGCIVIWNVRTGLEIGTLNFPHGIILSLALANDLDLLAVVAKKANSTINVWILSVRTGSVHDSVEHENCHVMFSYDVKWLVCVSSLKTDILDIRDDKYLWMMAVDLHYGLGKHLSQAIAFSPDCKYFTYGRESGMQVFDLAMFVRQIEPVSARVILQISFLRTCPKLVLEFETAFEPHEPHEPHELELWDLERGITEWREYGQLAPLESGSRILIFTSDCSRPSLWCLNGNAFERVETVPDFDNPIRSIFLSPDDTRALVNTSEKKLFIWDLETNAVRPLDAAVQGYLSRASWSVNAQRVAFITSDEKVRVLNVDLGTELLLTSLDIRSPAPEICLSSSGEICVYTDASYKVAVWNVNSRSQLLNVETKFRPMSVRVSEDDQHFAIADNQSFNFVSITDGSMRQEDKLPVYDKLLTISDDGTRLSTSWGPIVLKDEMMVLGTGDLLFLRPPWLYRNGKKLICVPEWHFNTFQYDDRGYYALCDKDARLIVFKTRFDPTGPNNI